MSKLKKNLKRVIKYIKKGIPQIYVNVLSREENSLFAGKRILVTGGSSGIGLEIARKCVRGGCLTCVITGRNEEKLKEACLKLGGVLSVIHLISEIQSIYKDTMKNVLRKQAVHLI